MTTHVRAPLRTIVVAIALVLLAGAVIAGLSTGTSPVEATSTQVNSTTVAVSPASTTIGCGEDLVIQFRLNDVVDLYGADVRVAYDPSILDVVDANPNSPGVQIAPGTLPDVSGGNGLIQVNDVDVGAGAISYAAVLLSPADPQSGDGPIASATFRGKADGTSQITFTSVLLSDQNASQIHADLVGGQIIVECNGQPTATTPPNPTATTPPQQPTPTTPPGDTCTHVVVPGDTLYSIANAYGVTVNDIMQANGITNPNLIYVGQELVIPGCNPGGPTPPPGPTEQPPDGCQHVVQPGDTLYSIARHYGTTVSAIMAANGIVNPDLIYVGQVLVIPNCGGPPPQPPSECFSYTVQPGDSLSSIAYRYGDTVYGLAQRNGIANPHLIYVGQVITVCPAGGQPPQPVPPPSPGPCACRYTHAVAPGDTVYSLSVQYGSDVQTIAHCNNLVTPDLIYVGQTLCIP